MGKIVVLTIHDDEEKILKCIQDCLVSEANFEVVEPETMNMLTFPKIEIDLYHRHVCVNRKNIVLTDIEFRILCYLASQPGRVFTYQQIYEAVWGEEYAYEKGIIMSHIRHIRQKLESEGDSYDYIENIRGVGYRFRKPMTDSS